MVEDETEPNFTRVVSSIARPRSRHSNAPPDSFDPNQPRVGRRESEPHSAEISYLYEVLKENYPAGRVTWDLHHYFQVDKIKLDIQFDVSFFHDLHIPYTLSSYRASKFNDRVPTIAFNVLSKSTWHADLGEHVDYCNRLGILVYVVFPAFHVATEFYRPPFLRAYIRQPNGEYHQEELHAVSLGNDGELLEEKLISLPEPLPFRLGLMELPEPHEGGWKHYRCILVDVKEPRVLPARVDRLETQYEQEKARAEQEKARAEMAEDRIAELEKILQDKDSTPRPREK